MKSKIFITATNTNIGKTYISLNLIRLFSKLGFKVGVVKPIETGVVDGIPSDGTALLEECRKYNPMMSNVSIDEVVPYQFQLPASPYVAKGRETISIDKIRESIHNIEQFCDIVIVEGAGGLLVPIERNYFMIDLIQELGYRTLLVAPSNLGSINDTLLSIDKLSQRGIDFHWTINLYRDMDTFPEITQPFYLDHFGEVPIFQNSSLEIAKKLIYR